MDLSDREFRKAVIIAMFSEAVGQSKFPNLVLEEVLSPIYSPGDQWEGDLSNVDPDLLREAVGEVVRNVLELTATRALLTSQTVRRALRASKCHYLWFC